MFLQREQNESIKDLTSNRGIKEQVENILSTLATNSTADMHAAFRQSIDENPTDRTPRLIYADFLEEHGDKPRADEMRKIVARGDKIQQYRNIIGAIGRNKDRMYHDAARLHLAEAKIPQKVKSTIHAHINMAEHPSEGGGPNPYDTTDDELTGIHHMIFDAEERNRGSR